MEEHWLHEPVGSEASALNEFDFSVDIAQDSDSEHEEEHHSHHHCHPGVTTAVDSQHHASCFGIGQFIDAPMPKTLDDQLHHRGNDQHHGGSEPDGVKPQPRPDTSSLDFSYACSKNIPPEYSSLEHFILQGDGKHLKDFLGLYENPHEIAEAFHRLRIIMGATKYDTKSEYGFYYLLTYTTGSLLPDLSVENLVTHSIKELLEELFISTYYLLECDVQISVVALPTNLTAFEKEWIRCHPVGGIRLRKKQTDADGDNVFQLGIMERLEAYLVEDRDECDYKTEEAEEEAVIKHWEKRRDWCLGCSEIGEMPNFNLPKYHIKNATESEFKDAFQQLLDEIEATIGDTLNTQLQSDFAIVPTQRA